MIQEGKSIFAKKIKATVPTMPEYESYIQEIKSIWENGIMTNNGEKVMKLKDMLTEYLDCPNMDLLVNGHSALLLAIKLMDLKGEVITSPFTFVSTTNAIVQNGLIPVFGDIDESYNLNPDVIEELITPNTSAIITPHIFGIPCDVIKIENIARKYHLKIIYDGAQAFGTKVYGKPISAYGDMTIFSFHAIKVFNSIEGGGLVYQDPKLHEKIESYRNFGISYEDLKSDVQFCGINAKMNEFQAAMGIVNLPLHNSEIAKRKRLAQIYCECLSDITGIHTYSYSKDVDYNYAYFPIKVTEEYGVTRDELWRKLHGQGVETRKLYDTLTCDYSCYKDRQYVRKTIYADRVKDITLDLPIYGTLTEDDIIYICELIKALKE